MRECDVLMFVGHDGQSRATRAAFEYGRCGTPFNQPVCLQAGESINWGRLGMHEYLHVCKLCALQLQSRGEEQAYENKCRMEVVNSMERQWLS
jgi:hypothetical protein